MLSTVIILDTNCYAHLVDHASQDVVRAGVGAIGLRIHPTWINVWEALRLENTGKRDRLLSAMASLMDGPVLPSPDDILYGGALALKDGQPVGFDTSRLREFILNPSSISADNIREANELLGAVEGRFRTRVSAARTLVRKHYKAAFKNSERPSPADMFALWRRSLNPRQFVQFEIDQLGMTGQIDAQKLLARPEWRLYVDAYGMAFFRQTVPPQQHRWVGRWDAYQLIYMAIADRIVSHDKAFVEAAQEVLHRYYLGKQAMYWPEFLERCHQGGEWGPRPSL